MWRLDDSRSVLYEDEIRSVAVGYAEVGLGGLEIAFARKQEGGPEGTDFHCLKLDSSGCYTVTGSPMATSVSTG